MVSMSITEVLLMLQDMIAAVTDCVSALKSSHKKSPDCVSYKSGDLPILWSFNLEALGDDRTRMNVTGCIDQLRYNTEPSVIININRVLVIAQIRHRRSC